MPDFYIQIYKNRLSFLSNVSICINFIHKNNLYIYQCAVTEQNRGNKFMLIYPDLILNVIQLCYDLYRGTLRTLHFPFIKIMRQSVYPALLTLNVFLLSFALINLLHVFSNIFVIIKIDKIFWQIVKKLYISLQG